MALNDGCASLEEAVNAYIFKKTEDNNLKLREELVSFINRNDTVLTSVRILKRVLPLMMLRMKRMPTDRDPFPSALSVRATEHGSPHLHPTSRRLSVRDTSFSRPVSYGFSTMLFPSMM